jgi:hypothetical protein
MIEDVQRLRAELPVLFAGERADNFYLLLSGSVCIEARMGSCALSVQILGGRLAQTYRKLTLVLDKSRATSTRSSGWTSSAIRSSAL